MRDCSLTKNQITYFLSLYINVFSPFFTLPLPVLQLFTSLFKLLLMNTSQEKLFTFTIQTHTTCCWDWRQLFLSLTTLHIAKQRPKSSNNKLLPESVLASNLLSPLWAILHAVFFASKLFFISPHASAPRRQVSHVALHHKQQISRHPDTARCLKATLWRVILIYPFNLGGKVNRS